MHNFKIMGKLILNLAVSLDGYIEGPNGEYDWCFTDQDYGMTAFLEQVDTIFFGRKSYDLQASMEKEYFPNHRKIVFSRQQLEVRSGYELVVSPSREKVLDMIRQTEKDIWLFGGRILFDQFVIWGLVDKIILSVHPVLLGGGKQIFGSYPERMLLNLDHVIQYDSGLVQLMYQMPVSGD